MSDAAENRKLSEWALPIAAVVVLHLGLVAVPVHFSEAHSEQPPPVELSMVAAPELESPPPAETPDPEPDPEPEPEPAPESEPEPKPEPEPEAPIEANEPEQVPEEPEVAVADDKPNIEEEVTKEEVVEEDVEAVDEVVERPDVEEVLDLNPLDSSARPPEPTPEPKPAEEAAAVDWQGYGRDVMQAVQSEKEYPRMAARMGWEGTTTVRITIDRDGELSTPPDIVDSSDHDALDEEVVRMVEAAAPFERFPSASDDDDQEFVIPIRFELRS